MAIGAALILAAGAVATFTPPTAQAADQPATRPATQPATAPAPLDPARIRDIAAALPASPGGVGRPITDRAAWTALAKSGRYDSYLPSAEELSTRPVPDQPDDLFLEYSLTGNRSNWERVAFARRRALAVLTWAECLEDRGRFLPKIREYIDATCSERTWVWSAHDRDLLNFKGEAADIDLGAAEFAWQIATVRWLLAERLPHETRDAIVANVRRRVVEPYRAAVAGTSKPTVWSARTNNWNAVCHAGVVGATLATVEDRLVRATVVAAAERDVRHFIDGFGPDGYCDEGLGYWNYGVGHYVLLAETVRQATDGRFDFMDRPGVRQFSNFGTRIQIVPGVAPAFADCGIGAAPASQVMRYVNARFGLGLAGYEPVDVHLARRYLYEQAVHTFLDPAGLPKPDPAAQAAAPESPLRSWFDSAGVLVARPGTGSTCRIGVALKGGHNAEKHNHNDLGSFVVAVDGHPVLLDPGNEHYTARTFGPNRYDSKLLNSFGHPVPVVAGKLQKAGKSALAAVVRTEFTNDRDTIVLDLTSAYSVRDLKKLERTFVYDRRGAGALTVTDRATFSSPQTFGTALVTLGQLLRHEGDTVVIGDAAHAVECRVDTGGVAYRITPELIEENAPVKPTRVGVQLDEPTVSASVSVTIAPMAR